MKCIYITKKLNTALHLFKQNMKFSRTTSTFFRHVSVQTPVLKTHEITMKSCGVLYEKWKQTGRFSKLPNSELTFQVNYFDTFKSLEHIDNKEAPVVVALHGAPGSCNDFSSFAEFLQDKGVRVIVPSFPDFSSFHPGIFRHTEVEKAQYVKDFLSAVSVSKVDLLVCHSSAVYPSLLLCLDQNPIVKSLAMLNPGTFSLKMPAIRYYTFLKLMVKASESPIFLKMLEVIGPLLLKLARVPVRTDNFLDPLLSATTMVHADIPKPKEKFHQLLSAGIPIFYAFSENDRLVGGKSASELANFLGAEPSDICFINKDGVVERKGHETPNLKVMSFEKGSHYVFLKYPHIINPAIYEFLVQQKPVQSSY